MSNSFPEFTQPGKKPVVNSIFDFSAEALGELRLWLEQNPPAIGISNILGFSQFTAKSSDLITTSETTVSTTYTNLATVGPTLSGLSDGRYVLFLTNLSAIATGGQQAYMGISINGAAASDAVATQSWSANFSTPTTPLLVTLSNGGNNTIVAKYRSSGGSTATFASRQIVAFRYANK